MNSRNYYIANGHHISLVWSLMLLFVAPAYLKNIGPEIPLISSVNITNNESAPDAININDEKLTTASTSHQFENEISITISNTTTLTNENMTSLTDVKIMSQAEVEPITGVANDRALIEVPSVTIKESNEGATSPNRDTISNVETNPSINDAKMNQENFDLESVIRANHKNIDNTLNKQNSGSVSNTEQNEKEELQNSPNPELGLTDQQAQKPDNAQISEEIHKQDNTPVTTHDESRSLEKTVKVASEDNNPKTILATKPEILVPEFNENKTQELDEVVHGIDGASDGTAGNVNLSPDPETMLHGKKSGYKHEEHEQEEISVNNDSPPPIHLEKRPHDGALVQSHADKAEQKLENGTDTNKKSNGTGSQEKASSSLVNVHGPRRNFPTDLDEVLHGGRKHTHDEYPSSSNLSEFSEKLPGPASNKLSEPASDKLQGPALDVADLEAMLRLSSDKNIGDKGKEEKHVEKSDPDKSPKTQDAAGAFHLHKTPDGPVRTNNPTVEYKDLKNRAISIGKLRRDEADDSDKLKNTEEKEDKSKGWSFGLSFLSDTTWKDLLAAQRRYLSNLWDESTTITSDRDKPKHTAKIHDEA